MGVDKNVAYAPAYPLDHADNDAFAVGTIAEDIGFGIHDLSFQNKMD